MSVLLIAPTGREAAVCGPGVLVCGAGRDAAAVVSSQLERGGVDSVVLAGICGGLDPSLAPGSLILARRLVAPDQPELMPRTAFLGASQRRLRGSGVAFVSSTLLSVHRPAGSRVEKTNLWNAHGAAGVDMESYTVARAAEAHNVAWLVIRAVVDPAGMSLPKGVLDWSDERDEGKIVRRMAMHPRDWPAYGRLALDLRRALGALRQGVPLVVEAASSVVGGSGERSSGSRLAILE